MTYEQLIQHGDKLYSDGAHIPAIQTYAEAAMMAPARKEALIALGLAYKDMGDLQGAVDFFEKAAVMDREDAFIRFMIGIAKYENGTPEEAEEYLLRAIEMVEDLVSSAGEPANTRNANTIAEMSFILDDARALVSRIQTEAAVKA